MSEKLPALEQWLAHTRALADQYHLSVDRAYIQTTSLVWVQLENGTCQYWVAADRLPQGAVVVGPARPGYLAILIAVD